MARKLPRAREAGFTLVELMMTLALLSVMVGVMGYTYYILLRSWGYELNRLEAKTEPTIAMDQFWRDAESALTMICADASQVRFTNTAPCGFAASCTLIPLPNCVTEHRFDNVNLRLNRTVGAATRTVANLISSATFSYYNAAGVLMGTPVPAAQLPNIRMIRLVLQGQRTSLFATETFTLRNQISPRNLK